MVTKYEIAGLQCCCSTVGRTDRIAYILYPMNVLAEWIEPAAAKYDTNIVVITGMDWQNVFSPWPAPGVPKGTPDFKGQSPEFLSQLTQTVIPKVESALGIASDAERSLIGVSMSGLFALWQWMISDSFTNIASLSGSFWYEGFMTWMENIDIPEKTGKGFFLLGDRESKSKVKAFNSVETNTHAIIDLLDKAGIETEFLSVPGDHYADPIPRLDAAFSSLYSPDICS